MSELNNQASCPECGKEYRALGTHWRWSPEHRPNITDHQKEIVTGLMMGDGCLSRYSKNPRMLLSMEESSIDYLKYIDDIFGCLGTGVGLKDTGAENAKKNEEQG